RDAADRREAATVPLRHQVARATSRQERQQGMNPGLPQPVPSANDAVMNLGSMDEVLLARAAQTPDAPAYIFLVDGVEEGPRLTYAELDREARTIATALQDVAGPGDRALLLYAPGLSFISAFFGCQYAGVVPVPAYPPRPDRLTQGWEILGNIAADCRPAAILT